MNFNYEDLLARMANGEEAGTLADEFAAALNKAIEENKKRSAQVQKDKDTEELIAAQRKYLEKYYPECVDTAAYGTVEDFYKAMDLLTGIKTGLDKVVAELVPEEKKTWDGEVQESEKKKDNIFEDFFKQMGWD